MPFFNWKKWWPQFVLKCSSLQLQRLFFSFQATLCKFNKLTIADLSPLKTKQGFSNRSAHWINQEGGWIIMCKNFFFLLQRLQRLTVKHFCSKYLYGHLHKIVKTKLIFTTNNKHLTTKLAIKLDVIPLRWDLWDFSFPTFSSHKWILFVFCDVNLSWITHTNLKTWTLGLNCWLQGRNHLSSVKFDLLFPGNYAMCK